jgi:AraC family transcriptional regulator
MCGSDAQRLEYMTAVQVADLDALPPAMGRMRVPAARYAVFVHDAPPSTLRLTWERVWREWLPGSGFTPAHTPDFERYASDGGIEVWFPVLAPR